MAVGENVLAHSSVSNGNYLSIQPGAGVEWQLLDLYFGGAWELYRTDGTNAIKIDEGITTGSLQQRKMIASNGIYFRIKNVSGGSVYMGYDGIIKKE
jgi:hypothetical protein